MKEDRSFFDDGLDQMQTEARKTLQRHEGIAGDMGFFKISDPQAFGNHVGILAIVLTLERVAFLEIVQ